MPAAHHRPLIDQLKEFPRETWILFFGTFVNRFGTFVMPFLVIYLTRRGHSASEAGIGAAAYGVGHLIASGVGGHLADRIGRRNTIALSMFGSALAMLALSQAQSYALIVVLACVAGSAAEMYRPASHALIGDLVRPDQRTMAFGMYRWAVNLGFAAGPALAGFLAEKSFLYVFIGDAITSVAYGLIALTMLPHGLRTYRKEEQFAEATRVALRDRPFLLFLFATALITFVDMQFGSTFALHVQKVGLSTTMYGLLVSLNGVIIILLELLITNYVQRFRPQPVIAVGFFLSGVGFALTGFADSVTALALTVVVWTFGEMICSPAAGTYITELAPERYRGRYMGLWTLTWSVGMILGPSLGTLLFQKNPTALWVLCGVLGVLSAALALIRLPRTVTDSVPPPIRAVEGE